MEFLVSNKGGILACLDGHIYTKKRNGKVKIFWRCRLKSKNGCTACLTTSLERNNPELNGIHNHEPDVLTIDLIRARNRMKESAKQTNEKPFQIYSAVVATCDVTVRQRLPPQENCCRSMRNQRPTFKNPKTFGRIRRNSRRIQQNCWPESRKFLTL